MNILIVVSGAITDIDGELYKDKGTVEFFKEISGETSSTYWLEPINKPDNTEQGLHGAKVPLDDINILVKHVTVVGQYRLPYLLRKSYFFLLAISKLIILFSTKKVDFVYLYMPSRLSILTGYLAYAFNIPFGIYIRGMYPEDSKEYQSLFKKAKFVLVVGKYFQEKINFFNPNTHIVSPMIDITRDDLYQKIIIKKESFNILFVGRVENDKGIWELLYAAEILSKKGNNIKFNIVGGGDQLNAIKMYIAKNNLKEYVNVHGLIADKKELRNMYLDTDIFILPTHHEGFPRVLYEAMTYSIPIVTTFVGSISSVMIDKYNCIEIPVNNSNKIVESISLLENDIELRKRLSKNSIKTMEGFFETKSIYSHSQQVIRLAKGEKI